MPISINDKPLEADLESLGQHQDIPAKKGTVALAVLRDAVAAWRQTGDPGAWRSARSNGHAGAAVDPGSTDHPPSPTGGGSDPDSQDSAASVPTGRPTDDPGESPDPSISAA